MSTDMPLAATLDQLNSLAEHCRTRLEAKHHAREALLEHSRTLTRHCANAIRAMHRQEWDAAQRGLQQAGAVVEQMKSQQPDHPDLVAAGYTQDSFKEYVEATTVYAMLRGEPLPTPETLGVGEAAFLNGLTEAASELRRYVLDILREDHSSTAETLLQLMEGVYDVMVTLDFPDAISNSLRHRTDSLRAVLERTRGDVTLSLRQQRLEAAIQRASSSSAPDAS